MKPLQFLLLQFVLLSFQTLAQAPGNWFNLDPTENKVYGVSTEKSYRELLAGKQSSPVIVAVLDNGVDFEHEDLRNNMWTNVGEIPENGIDDDKNGYVDDIHGWNFIGGKDGNVEYDNLEMTRLLRKLDPIYRSAVPESLTSKTSKQEYSLYRAVKDEYNKNLETSTGNYRLYKDLETRYQALYNSAKNQLNKDTIGLRELQAFTSTSTSEMKTRTEAMRFIKGGTIKNLNALLDEIHEAYEYYRTSVEYNLNLDFDPRSIVGDDYANSSEKYYGNSDCKGPDPFHGTHVSGIIAATRGNGIGMDGIATNVKIMAVRCVPSGDERDKDVANAILYAVDNGATVLNMSFGKKYYWDKEAVDKAVRYAESKGVLLVHGAGNDHENTDSVKFYPNKKYQSKGEATNFIEVGASGWDTDNNFAADFSNYGKKTVDLFAPGVDIYSTAPKNSYKPASGTSMAAPVVSGVAAVIKSYYPDLQAKDIKKILLKSVNKDLAEKKVKRPGTATEVEFESLSKTGGVVNLYEALKLAAKYSKIKP